MKNTLKPGSIAFGFGLMLTTLGQAQPGAPSGTPLSFKVPPHALSAISFSAAPNVQCSVAPANGSGSGQAFTVYTNDEGTATFYVTPSQESSSAAQLVVTCSSGNQQTIEIQPVAGTKPLVARAPSNAATNARLGYTVRPALTGDPMALSNQQLVKLKYPMRPDPQKAPGAYASWLKDVSKPATFIPPKTVNVEGRYHGPAQTYPGANTQSARLATSDTTTSTVAYPSPYWSGYALNGAASPFVFVEGEWNVPAIVAAEYGTGTNSDLAIGFENVSAGTEQDAIGYDGFSYVVYYPWTEVDPQPGMAAISNFTVNPGDEIYCEVWIADVNDDLNPNGGYAYFYLRDFTTGQYTQFSIPAGSFSGVTAEWVMERPTNNGSPGDLSDYWYAVMTGAYAETSDGNYYTWQGGVGLDSSTRFNMYNGNDMLSSVYPTDSDTMYFIWANYN